MEQKHSYFLEAAAAVTVMATWWDVVPAIAASVGAIYYGLQAWETKTVQGWRSKWHGTSVDKD